MERQSLSVRLESDAFSCENIRISKLEGEEQISRMFEFVVTFTYGDKRGLDVGEVAGSEVTVTFTQEGADIRTIHGMVATVDDLLETESDYRTYRIVIVPRLYRLTLIETLDIFIDTNIPDLIERKLEQVGLASSFENHLSATYPKRDFIVQYRETDLAFVSRLLEHLGVSFVFRHGDGEDRFALVDDSAGFPPLSAGGGGADVDYHPRGESNGVYRLECRTGIIPNIHVVRDYNYRTPSLELSGMHESAIGYGGGIVEYGNHTKTPESAEKLARVRMEEHEAGETVYSGESSAIALSAGFNFAISDHPHVDETLLLVSVKHFMTQPGMMTGSEGEPSTYHNEFTAIPALRTYRPPRVTPKPRIFGFTPGLIEKPDGGAGKVPALDQHGRYTVRFLFDTAEPGERQASHPVRMAQLSSGSHYGTHFPLRPGTEVLLAFSDGDPDRPIIIGAVPNPETTTPVTNSEPLKSRIKTATGIVIEFSENS